MLKAVYAYLGIAIPRTHELMVLFNFAEEKTDLSHFDKDDILAISDYYETDRYPGPRYAQPERKEVEHYFTVAEKLFKGINDFIK
ncbi:HEPN domain-containing protein [uncultured Draconibacterium sp.]|uniref:HEPN domain-containing protein n=1 Tax=uncultured Draconibacterium sp. TaxID=1573823 RepID=UPI0025FB93DD|nr:HEPN domain-containing protein [uncultured Draconibacterium sp.]